MSERNEVLEFLDELVASDVEIRREAEKEHKRLALAMAMVRSRKTRGLSQAEVARRLGVSQSWVSKLENPDIAHTFESIIDYLHAIEAELDMAIRAESEVFTVSRSEASNAAEESGGTFLGQAWEGPTGEVRQTLVLSFSRRKAHLRHPDRGRLQADTQLAYRAPSTTSLLASDATSSTYGGRHDPIN